jgi:hypothetical protein
MRRSTGGAIYKMVTQVAPGVIRPLRVLWNQMIGFLFVVMALAAAPLIFRDVRHFDGDIDGVGKIGVEAIFMGIMLYFGITSFLRARKIDRP